MRIVECLNCAIDDTWNAARTTTLSQRQNLNTGINPFSMLDEFESLDAEQYELVYGPGSAANRNKQGTSTPQTSSGYTSGGNGKA